jgi:hypothetical protein
MTGNVSIFYQGGSGGFALYYYLLLSGQFQHSIDQTWKLIYSQYPTDLLTNSRNWKTQEHWPDNHELKKRSSSTLFLVCNPLWGKDSYQQIFDNTHKIFLYANLRLQLRMAWEKRAWWFTDLTRKVINAPADNKVYLRQIINSAATLDNHDVDPMVPKIIDYYKPDNIIQLEEFVKGKNLPGTPNVHQLKFLDYWISLQPKKALRLMNSV